MATAGMRPRRRTAGVLVMGMGLLVGALGLIGGPAGAASVEPELVGTNVKCKDIQPSGVTWNELKINGVPLNQAYSDTGENDPDDNPGPLVFTVSNGDNDSFDWSSNIDVEAVFVKGGTGGGGNLYRYPGTSDTSDTDLTTQTNPGGEKATISHVSVCYVEAQAPGTGNLAVSKDVVGGEGDESFDFTVDCGQVELLPGDEAFSLGDDETHAIQNLPDGTVCTVTETDPGGDVTTTVTVNGGTATEGLSADATIEEGQTATVAFTNSFPAPPPPPEVGGIVVSKDVTAGPEGQSFSFTLACEGLDLADTDESFTLTDGQSKTVGDIPAGSECTVTEADPGTGWSTTVSINGGATTDARTADVTVAPDANQTVDFTNEFTAVLTFQPTTTLVPVLAGVTTTTAPPTVLGVQQQRGLAATGPFETGVMMATAAVLLLFGAALIAGSRQGVMAVAVPAGIPAASVARLLTVAALRLWVEDDSARRRR